MDEKSESQTTANQLLQKMFDVEMRFLHADSEDIEVLSSAFHPDVVIHEPGSLPYAGQWKGLAGVGALFRAMRKVWSDVGVEGLEAARVDDTVFMTCRLRLTSRTRGVTIEQPFAEVLRFKGDLLIDGMPFYYDTSEIVSALR